LVKVLFYQRVPALFRKEFFELLNEKVRVDLAYGIPSAQEEMKCFEQVSINDYMHSDIRYYFFNSICFDHNWRECLDISNPNIVVITPTPRMISNYLLTFYCKLKRIPIVGWGMGEMPNRSIMWKKIHAFAQWSLVRFLDGIVCYSTTAAAYYRSIGVNHIRVAHNSIDTDSAMRDLEVVKGYAQPKIQEIADDLSVDFCKFKIVYLGRIIPEKKLDKLIKAIQGIPNLQLLVIGDGDPMYVSSLKDISISENVDVNFLGHRSGIELAEIMYLSDVFVLPSLGGLAINHAMSFGLPCIVSQGDGTERDLVRDGFNGFIFRSGDFQHLRFCVMAALEHDSLALLGLNSMGVIKSKINIDNMVFEMQSFIIETCKIKGFG
jgi:glycosyltransferase involved in cell wall biosynthesis